MRFKKKMKSQMRKNG